MDAQQQQALLERHQPYLRYDSHEAFFADAAEMFTDAPGMRLRAPGRKTNVATAGHGLSLALLSHPDDVYPGTKVKPSSGDTLGIPDKDYRKRAARLHEDQNLANVVYGHVATDSDDAVWLQYWYCYYYNDYNLIGPFVAAGLHEGDWETVQIRLGADGKPNHAVYAQHAHARDRAWDHLELVPETERPVVYVARGSHASYFEAGRQSTGVWFDFADGKRQSPARQRLVHVVDGDATFRWVRWPGHWGDTPKTGGIAPADSPRSPGVRRHWRDPLELLHVAKELASAPPARRPSLPAPPGVSVTRTATGARLDWTVTPAPDGNRPTLLTVTVNSKDESAPPQTTNYEITGASDTIDLPGLDPAKRYDIFVSDATADGLPSDSVRRDLEAVA
jgi:hypothetical protein